MFNQQEVAIYRTLLVLLSEVVPSSSIEEVNKEVVAKNAESREKKRSPYMIVSLEQKAVVGKYAADHGTTYAIRHFVKDLPNLKESTVKRMEGCLLKRSSHSS